MLPTHHAAATALAALPLLRRGWPLSKVVQFAAAAVLIDADHYASYVWKIRDLSLSRAYWFHRRRGHHPYRLHRPAVVFDFHRPLHAPALLAALTVLARRWPVLWPVVAGMLFHRALDYAWSATHAVWAVKRAAGADTLFLPQGEPRVPIPLAGPGGPRSGRWFRRGVAVDQATAYEGTAYQRTLK